MTIRTIKQKPAEEREEEAQEHGLAEGEIIYRSVRQDGMHTLEETTAALAWSGMAAGISMASLGIPAFIQPIHLLLSSILFVGLFAFRLNVKK